MPRLVHEVCTSVVGDFPSAVGIEDYTSAVGDYTSVVGDDSETRMWTVVTSESWEVRDFQRAVLVMRQECSRTYTMWWYPLCNRFAVEGRDIPVSTVRDALKYVWRYEA